MAICRYFGEEMNDSDPAVRTAYCNKMCDVCKYPERTLAKRNDFSFASSVSTQAVQHIEMPDVVPRVGDGAGSGAMLKKQAYIRPPPAVQNRFYPPAHDVEVPKRALEDVVDGQQQQHKRLRMAPSSSGTYAWPLHGLKRRAN